MRTKLGYAVSALLSFLLCAVMLCGAVLPTAAEAAKLPSLDYSNPAITNSKSLSVYDLYVRLLNRVPTEGETLYWQAKGFSLLYNDDIPSDRIDTHYEKEMLDVTVAPYIYTAANGATVTWTPESIQLETVDGEWKEYTLTEQNGVYSAQISCKYSGDFGMKVAYSCEIEIAGSVVEALHTEAYSEGAKALFLMTTYEEHKTEYNKYLEKLDDYKNYVDNKKAYEKYLEDIAEYTVAKKAYDDYLAEYAVYQALADAEQQWAKYWADQNAYTTNKELYNAYSEYAKSYQAAVDTLEMFEAIFAKEPRGWCMYNDIMGNAVTQVLQRQDELILAGGNAADITLAGVATENLRVLLKGYNDLRTAKYNSDHDKYEKLYQYYKDNYDALTKNFCDLYKTLNGLYKNDAVSGYIALENKTLHYRQLVGHLFVISTALDTFASRDEKAWRIDRKTLNQVIDMDVHYFEDGNQWYPTAVYPEEEVAYAEEPAVPKKPDVEEPMYVPDAPTPVENPGDAPKKVDDPGEPEDEPDPVDEPISPEPGFSNAVKELYKDVRDGKLSLYEGSIPQTIPLKLNIEVGQTISIENVKTVTFYDLEGNPYRVEQKNYGGTVKCAPLEHEPTAQYFYEFLGWKDADGNLYGKTAEIEVTKNLSLYPDYRKTTRTYTVTFIVKNEWGEDQTQTITRPYGTKLDPKQFVKIPATTKEYLYTFSGWQNSIGEPIEVTTITGNATYKGYIQRTLRKYTVTWVINERNETIPKEWAYGETPVFDGDMSVSSSTHAYHFVGWYPPVDDVKNDVTYTAMYQKIPLAYCDNVELEILHSDTEITVKATGSVVSVEQAALLAVQENKKLTVCWDGVLSASLAGEELQSYINMGTPKLMLYVSQEGNIEVYEFKYLGLGSNVSALPSINVQFAYSKTNNQVTLFEVQTADGWERLEKDQATVVGNFKARRFYSYSIFCVPNEFCNVKQPQMAKQATEGEWVSIDLECVYGYKVVGATFVTADGETVTVSGVSFQMPASAATLTLQVEKIVYRITFMVDGVVWSTAEYYAGDKIVLPENPTKEAEDGYVYTFAGWGDVPAVAKGEEEELVFEASFSKAQIVSDYETGHNNNVLFAIILPCIGAAVVLLVAFLILNRVVRKRGGWKIVRIKIACRIRSFFKKKNTNSKNIKDEKDTNIKTTKKVNDKQIPKTKK